MNKDNKRLLIWILYNVVLAVAFITFPIKYYINDYDCTFGLFMLCGIGIGKILRKYYK